MDLKRYWSPSAIIYDPLKAGSIDGTDTEPHDKAVIRAQNAKYRPNSKVKGKPECTIFVARLDHRTSESDLLKVSIFFISKFEFDSFSFVNS